MTFDKEQIDKLTKKLDSAVVQPPSQYGPKGEYLEGWFVIAEANRIFGFDGWSYEVISATAVAQEPRKIGQQKRDGWGVTYTSKVRVEVAGVYREDFGAGHGYDVDLGLAHESAIKEAVTDALKRALRTFGNPFGLALYDKSRANVEVAAPEPKPDPKPAMYNTLVAELKKGATKEDLNRMWRDAEFIALRQTMPDHWQAKLKDEASEIGKGKPSEGDAVKSIQEAFPGSKVTNERITDISGRELEYQEAGE